MLFWFNQSDSFGKNLVGGGYINYAFDWYAGFYRKAQATNNLFLRIALLFISIVHFVGQIVVIGSILYVILANYDSNLLQTFYR